MVFEAGKLNREQICSIIENKVNDLENADWLLESASIYVSAEKFAYFDKLLSDYLEPGIYCSLWKRKIARIFPAKQIKDLLREKSAEMLEVENWVKNDICTTEDIATVLFQLLDEVMEVDDRKSFYIRFNCIKCLTDLNKEYCQRIIANEFDFDKLIFWFIGLSEYFDFQLLQKKFIYFSPSDQVKIIKRLFHLKNKGLFDFTIEDLENITKADLDSFLANEKFNDEFVLDISTSLIIELIKNYQQKGRFLADNQLLKLILHDIGSERDKKFKIENYFETCAGRMNVEWDWRTNGTIYKRMNGTGHYFVFEFEYNAALIEAVKNITGRKYDSGARNWTVPGTSQPQVLEFAKKHRFFLNYGANNYSNNPHLAKFQRGEIPNGIKFCEGRIANNQDERLATSFWWCANQKCHQHCETEHLSADEYLPYTLLDFLKVFKINVDENNNYGFFPNGKYYHLISQINRFNRLLERLYCLECNEILFPVMAANFAAHTVVRFSCQNEKCGRHGAEVYLNHCLDGKCNSIIDSRVSKKCENGLYICNGCGGCCSHDMLSRKLTNLQTTGGLVHSHLIDCVNEGRGHREKNEYFCYKCAAIMTEVIDDINNDPRFFKCLACGDVEYHPLSTIQRLHLNLRRPNYPVVNLTDILGNSNRGTKNDSTGFDF